MALLHNHLEQSKRAVPFVEQRIEEKEINRALARSVRTQGESSLAPGSPHSSACDPERTSVLTPLGGPRDADYAACCMGGVANSCFRSFA